MKLRNTISICQCLILTELLEDLDGFRGSLEDDTWWWRLEGNGGFTVKSMYKKLELSVGESSVSVEDRRVFTHIWRSSAPSKVIAFSWKLLHDRIPTRVNLRHRQALPPEMLVCCVLCEGIPETTNHLFIRCTFAMDVWRGVWRWLDVLLEIPQNVFLLWEGWNEVVVNNRIHKGFRLIWHAVVWSLWRMRNDRIFKISICGVEEVVEAVKVLSWRCP